MADTGQNRCYLRHISGFQPKIAVVIGSTVWFWVVIPGTIGRGCYRQHIWWKNRQTLACWLSIHRCIFALELLFTAQFRVLLNTAQFGIFLLLFTAHFVFGLLFSAQFQNCCYLRHNSKNPLLLFTTQFRLGLLFSAQLWWVVSADTICGGSVQNSNGCYSRHISEFLFGGCYAAHNFPLCCYLWHSLPRC